MRARQREEFGGVNWGAAFFGWLVAVGLGALLVGLLAAMGAAVGLTDVSATDTAGNVTDIGIGGTIVLLAALASRTTSAATSPGGCRASTARARAWARG